MADDGVCIVLVFLQEVIGARECYLVDIAVYLGGCHAYAAVAHGDGILSDCDADGQVTHLTLELALGGKCLEFLAGINCVRYYLAEENLAVTVEKLFDDREYVLGRYSNLTFLHSYIVFSLITCYALYNTTKMPDGLPTDILAEQESGADSMSLLGVIP